MIEAPCIVERDRQGCEQLLDAAGNGEVLIVTPVPGTYQWAEIDRIALGLRISPPMRRQASV